MPGIYHQAGCCCEECPCEAGEADFEMAGCDDCTPRYMSLKLRDVAEDVDGDYCLEAVEMWPGFGYFWRLETAGLIFIVSIEPALLWYKFFITVRPVGLPGFLFYAERIASSGCNSKYADIPNEEPGKTGTATIQGCC
jgi:hypothetical protein